MKVSELMDLLEEIETVRDKCWSEEPLTEDDYDRLVVLLDNYRDILLSRDVNI